MVQWNSARVRFVLLRILTDSFMSPSFSSFLLSARDERFSSASRLLLHLASFGRILWCFRPQALSAEMKRRKDHIDGEKRKEKLNNRAKHVGALSDYVDRDLGDESLPPPPVFNRVRAT